MRMALICPICGRAFFAEDELRVTCSRRCGSKMKGFGDRERAHLIAEAEKKRRPARTDCRCYDPKYHDCNGLSALWCEVEECKFYKQKKASKT